MKKITDVTATVVDYGTFISLADKLSEQCKKVNYYSPIDSEYRNIQECVKGAGLGREGHRIERIDQFIDSKIIRETDLFIFPDIGWGAPQRYLRDECHKAVWGNMGFDFYEMYRTQFLKLLESLGMPVAPYVVIKGLTALAEHLKKVNDKWIKIDRYRDNMETWHHLDWTHSARKIEELNAVFGGAREIPVFIVQDRIETNGEIGYDGWSIDGQFPSASFAGYEKKNQLYLGAYTRYKDLPEEVKYVNEKISKRLAQFGYRNFIATEIRKGIDRKAYFIDPTPRMPGQTGEQLTETCENFGEVIWGGACGHVVEPKFLFNFAVEATMHYTENDEYWKTLRVPKEVERWTKLYHYCMIDGVYHFPVTRNDELGVLLGVGKTVDEAINHVKKNFEYFKNEPVDIRFQEFACLLNELQKAPIKITTDKIPDPSSIFD